MPAPPNQHPPPARRPERPVVHFYDDLAPTEAAPRREDNRPWSVSAVASLAVAILAPFPVVPQIAGVTLGVIGWRRTAKGARRGRLIAALGAGLNAVLLVAWLGVFALAGSAAYVLQGAETTADNFAAAVAAGRLDAAADLARPPLDRGEIAWRASAFADPRARWALRTAINDVDGPTLDTVHVDARLTAAAPRRTVRFRLKLERDGLGYRVVGFDADDREPVRERADRRTRTEPPATPPATAPAP